MCMTIHDKYIDSLKIWNDPDTNFIWQVEVEDKMFSWEESFEYVKKLNNENYGGYDNWKIPTYSELKTITTEKSFDNKKSKFTRF